LSKSVPVLRGPSATGDTSLPQTGCRPSSLLLAPTLHLTYIMRGLRGWRIARIRGVDVKLHFSLAFILAYIWMVGSLQFPIVAEQAGFDPAGIAGAPVIWGGIFAIALFLSVLLHEFGHVIMAQSLGGKVDGITLMMLGGVSEIRKMPEGKYQEFKVAVVGPLVSFGIAAVLLFSRNLIPLPEWGLFAYWLGSVNIILGVFNLLPAFPMDGGRALRSLLSARKGRLKATRIAVRVGSFFAIAFAVFGLLQFNILLMLIALFLYAISHQELAVVESESALKDLKAGDVGFRVSAVSERETIEGAVRLMKEGHTLVLPVQGREPATISVKQAGKIPRNLWTTTMVSQVMETDTRALELSDPMDEALTDLYASENQALPLQENGRIVGIVRIADVSQEMQFRLLGGRQGTGNPDPESRIAS
jgi:Zn-dependent protease/CBS domain-containing protein